MSDISDAEAGALKAIEARLEPRTGLPQPVFDFAYAVMPIANIDLLAVERGRFLLSWRDDRFGQGWHIPGGVFRRGETMAERIAATARDELGADVRTDAAPSAILELLGERHNISFLYVAHLITGPDKRLVEPGPRAAPGDLCWFDAPPQQLYPAHEAYRAWMAQAASAGPPPGPVMLSYVVPQSGKAKPQDA